MRGLARLVRELRDIVRFVRTPRHLRELVFYAEDASYYTFFQGLLERLRSHTDLPFCYVTSDPDDPLLDRADEQMRCFYVRDFVLVFLQRLDTRLLVLSMPDLHQFRVTPGVGGVRLVYLFHNIGSYFHVIREQGVLRYDVMFCVGAHHLRELRREEEIYEAPQRELVEFGYHRLDALLAEHRRRPLAPPGSPARVFFAPGWGPWHERNSMLDLCGRDLIEKLLDAGHPIVFRPHPMTRIKYAESLDALYAEFSDRPGFVVDENVSNLEPFHSCDVMISDWSGVVYEFAFGVEKPVIFVDSPMKVNNPRYTDYGFEPIDAEIRDEIGVVLGMDETSRIVEVVNESVHDVEARRERIAKARERFVFNVGGSSAAGVEWIQQALGRQT